MGEYKTSKLLILSILLLMLVFSGQVKAERVAVLGFETDGIPWTDNKEFEEEILKGITREFTEKLHNEGTFDVIDNSKVNNVLEQTGYEYGEKMKPSFIPHISRTLENNLLILGAVNKLSVSETGELSIGPVTLSGIKAEVELSTRLVDARTGNTLLTYSGDGEATEGGLEIDEFEGISFGSKAFADSAVGKAITEAISDMTDMIVAEEEVIFKEYVEAGEAAKEEIIEGDIVDTIGDSLVLNIGEEDRIVEGSPGEIVRVIEGSGEEPMTVSYGEVEISSVDANTSIASIIDAEEDPELGDIVQVNLSDSGSAGDGRSSEDVIETVETKDFIVYIESAIRSKDEVTVSGTVEAKNEAEFTIFFPSGRFEFYDHEGRSNDTANEQVKIGSKTDSTNPGWHNASLTEEILEGYPQMISWTFGGVPEDADHLSRLKLYFETESVGEVEINLDGIDLVTY